MAEDTASLLDIALSRMTPLGPKCAVQLVYETTPADMLPQVKELIAATKGPDKPNGIRYSICREILEEKLGVYVPSDTISRHRRGVCACDK